MFLEYTVFTLGTLKTLSPLHKSHSRNFIDELFFFFKSLMFIYKGGDFIELFKRTTEKEYDLGICHYPLFGNKW